MGLLGWIGVAIVAVIVLVVLVVVVPTYLMVRRRSRWSIDVHYVVKPVLTDDDVQRAFDVALPGAKLDPELGGDGEWGAALGDEKYLIDLEERDEALQVPGGLAAKHTLQLCAIAAKKPTEAQQIELLEKLCRLAAPFAKSGGVLVSKTRPMSIDATDVSVPVDDAVLTRLAAGHSDFFEAGGSVLPASIRDMFVWGDEVSKSPRTFVQRRITVESTASLRHFFDGERSFDWTAVEAELEHRGWRATAREAKPGVMLIEFPEVQLVLNDVKRAARVMFDVKGTKTDAPSLHAQSLVAFAVPSADAWWAHLLYDDNNGVPAHLRLRLLAEISRALSLQHAPLVLAWDEPGHLVMPSDLVAATNEKDDRALAECVVGLRVSRVTNAPDESKSTISTTIGLADFGLPEVEMISSYERSKQFAPLLVDTAVQLLLRGPVFEDGHTVSRAASETEKLRVLYAQSLMNEDRFVLSLS